MSPRGGYRPNAGRKPKADARREVFYVRVRVGKSDAYRNAAKRAGMTIGAWVEKYLDRAIRPKE